VPDFPTTGMPPMIGRRLSIPEWLDYVAHYDFGRIAPSRLVLHHTYIPNEQQWRGLASMQGMQNYYRGLGWTAAPHVYSGPDGIWLFTPMSQVGIHAGTGNSGTVGGQFWYSIGLEMVGYFDTVRPAGAVWENAKAVMGGLSRRLGIPPEQLISFHRDYTNQKSCPGWAVTKEWVFAEVNAWLNNRPPPPPPPPPPPGWPPPELEELIELLTNESYKARGDGYSASSAIITFAVQNNLGFPVARLGQLTADGKSLQFQPFARDTLYLEVPDYGEVKRLSALLGGSIPSGGFARALLDASYQACGAVFHPEWAFHQYAVTNNLGPPIGDSARITVGGAAYSFQAFAVDTLYNLVPNWGDVRRLSQLATATDPAQVQLREALLAETYKKGGAVYHPEWAFHQLARRWNLGTVISGNYTATAGGKQYALQVYATDTLFNLVPNWKDVKRLSEVARPGATKPAVLGAEPGAPPVAAVLADGTLFEPPDAAHRVVRFRPYHAVPAARSRGRQTVELIVLRDERGPAERRMAQMVLPGARRTPHFYVARDGTTYQLVDEGLAARWAGLAVWNGRRRNLNPISIGVAVERAPGGPPEAQRAALERLLARLRADYRLPKRAVVRWERLH
jgi:hypothetical protein